MLDRIWRRWSEIQRDHTEIRLVSANWIFLAEGGKQW